MSQALLPVGDLPREPARTVRCRRCSRPLHDPEARALQLGPECRDWEAARRRGHIPQDTIPGT